MSLVAVLLALAFKPAQPNVVELPAALPSIRLSELRDLPERQLVRRVLGPLEPFPYLSLRDSFDSWALHRPARLWFWSRPRAGGHAGICQTERLIVQFEPALLSLSRDDPALSPAHFAMDRYYIIENREEAFGPYSPKERKGFELDAACAKLDPRLLHSVPADSAYQLVKAVKLVEELGAAARSGRVPAPLDCTRLNSNGEPPADDAACLRELVGLGEPSVHWVKNCDPRRAAPGGCTQVQLHRWFIEFDLDTGGHPIRIVIDGIEDTSAIE